MSGPYQSAKNLRRHSAHFNGLEWKCSGIEQSKALYQWRRSYKIIQLFWLFDSTPSPYIEICRIPPPRRIQTISLTNMTFFKSFELVVSSWNLFQLKKSLQFICRQNAAQRNTKWFFFLANWYSMCYLNCCFYILQVNIFKKKHTHTTKKPSTIEHKSHENLYHRTLEQNFLFLSHRALDLVLTKNVFTIFLAYANYFSYEII